MVGLASGKNIYTLRYTEVNSLLYKLNGIHEIRNLSMTEFEIDYESDGRVIATLLLKINPDADAHFKRLVNAKVCLIISTYQVRSKVYIVRFKTLSFTPISPFLS